MLRNADGGGSGCKIFWEKALQRFNVISVTRGWVGVQFPGKKLYVTLERPLTPLTFGRRTLRASRKGSCSADC